MVTAKSAVGSVTSTVAEAVLLSGLGSGAGDPTVAVLVTRAEVFPSSAPAPTAIITETVVVP